jgi:phage tail-like protein
MMPNRREFDRLTGYNFKVEISGVTVSPFLEVEGLESITAIKPTKNGDDLILRQQAGRTSYTNLIMRRGFTGNSELLNWRKKVIQGAFERRGGSILLLDKVGKEILRFNLFEVWPCRWKLGKLSGLSDDLLIEEIELVVEWFELA